MDCTDLLTVIVQAVLELSQEMIAATEANILTRAQALCPTTMITLLDIQANITRGVEDGVLLPCTSGAELVYLVRRDMLQLNPLNTRYAALLSGTPQFNCAI